MSIEQGIIDSDVYFGDEDEDVAEDSDYVKKGKRIKRKSNLDL